MSKQIIIENLPRKTRLDNFLASYFPNITRSTSKKLILGGLVTLNKSKAKPSNSINNGDLIEIDIDNIRSFIEHNELKEITPIKMDLDILFEDENTIILDKPPGTVVHPSYAHNEDTLMNGLTYYLLNKEQNPFVRVRPVHRLDKDTSGVILFSKNLDSHNFYATQFKRREVTKEYLAVVIGDFNKEPQIISSYISKRANELRYRSTDNINGDYAETEFIFQEYLGDNEQYSLIKSIPKTGRTHQIRVHLSDMGFPILGGTLYGGSEFKRLMLHAAKLTLKLYNVGNSNQLVEVASNKTQLFINNTVVNEVNPA